jgi:hypothetical protein
MTSRLKALLAVIVGCSCMLVLAQTDKASLINSTESNFIEAQRLALNEEKNKIADQFQAVSKACWQKFAVNDCLFKARQQKYQSLNPLDQLEIALNHRQRTLKELERRQRLSDKAMDAGKDKAVP